MKKITKHNTQSRRWFYSREHPVIIPSDTYGRDSQLNNTTGQELGAAIESPPPLFL